MSQGQHLQAAVVPPPGPDICDQRRGLGGEASLPSLGQLWVRKQDGLGEGVLEPGPAGL